MFKNINKNFIKIYLGQGVSQLTSSILQMAIVWYLIAQTNSALVIALSGIVGFLPQGILGVFIGPFIDRYNRKKIMIISDLVIATASLSLTIVGMFGEISTLIIMIVLFVRSIGTAFHTPSLNAIIPTIVSKEELDKYSGYGQTLQSISLLLSPVLASLFFSVWKIEQIVFLDVIGALIGVWTLLIVDVPQNKIGKIEKFKFIKEVKEGIKILKEERLFRFMLLGAIFSLVYIPIFVLYPMITLSYFVKSTWYAGLVEVIFGVGMLLGSVILGKFGAGKNKILSVGISCSMIGGVLLCSGILNKNMFVYFVILSAILGLVTPFYQGIQIVVFQERIANEYLGRVMSLINGMMAIATPIGIGISGVFSEKIGLEKYFLYSGIVLLALGCLYLLEKDK